MKKIISLILAGTMTLTFASAAYGDVSEKHWAYGEISVCEKDGLFSGYTDGNFKPNGLVTRAEAVKALGSDLPAWTSDNTAITREEAVFLVMSKIETEKPR